MKWSILLAVICLTIAILDEPIDLDLEYEYFIFLRFIVCAVFGFWAVKAQKQSKINWRNAFVLIALLYNPFLPVELGDADLWRVVNIATIGVIFLALKPFGFRLQSGFKKIGKRIKKGFSYLLMEEPAVVILGTVFLMAFLFLGGVKVWRMNPIGKAQVEEKERAHEEKLRSKLRSELIKFEWTAKAYTSRGGDLGFETYKFNEDIIDGLSNNLSLKEIESTLSEIESSNSFLLGGGDEFARELEGKAKV